MRDLDYWGTSDWGLQRLVMNGIADALRGPDAQTWTVSFGEFECTRGLEVMRLATVNKVAAIIRHRAATADRPEPWGSSAFIPRICAGRYGTRQQAAAMVNSVHAFLPLADEYGLSVGRLHRALLGLPHNAGGRIVSSATRERRRVAEPLLRFIAHSIAARPERDTGLPRGLDVSRDGVPSVSDGRLRALLLSSPAEDVPRIIRMYSDDGDPIERIEARILVHSALDDGAL